MSYLIVQLHGLTIYNVLLDFHYVTEPYIYNHMTDIKTGIKPGKTSWGLKTYSLI